jgi:hypothetical protein
MKKMLNRIFGILLIAATAVGMPLHGINKERAGVEAPLEHVAREVSILDHIVEQAGKVVQAKTNKVRLAAKEKLTTLMNNEDLDDTIKEAIIVDIEVINDSPIQTIKQKAYAHLLEAVKEINVQAEAIAVTEQATDLIKNAPEEERPGIIQRAYQKIQEATEYAKSMITTPVNYVFGKESSDAKTAFYAMVGASYLAAYVIGMKIGVRGTLEDLKQNEEWLGNMLWQAKLAKEGNGNKGPAWFYTFNPQEGGEITDQQKKQIHDIMVPVNEKIKQILKDAN